jgi:hypothetical protein
MATKHTKITKVFGTALERSRFRASWPLCSLWLIVFVPFVAAQSQLPLEPIRDVGQGVTAAYEGWYRNADGTFSLLVGYFNRNRKEALDIPIGPNNRIEPGGPDLGQPTHFLTRRQWGVFTITVPADFGDKKIVWTLTANGRTTSIPMGLNRDYEVEPFKDAAMGNTPPVLRLAPKGPALQGPPRGVAASLTTTVNEPLTLPAWVTDEASVEPGARPPTGPPVSITWSVYRGPGAVAFDAAKPKVDPTDGKTTANATFTVPGEYVLRAQVNDRSGDGGGGFQCCWTNGHVKVTVLPAK